MDIALLLPVIIFIGMTLLVLTVFFRIRSVRERRRLLQKLKDEGRDPAQARTSLSITTIIKLYQTRTKQYIGKVASVFGNTSKPKQEEEYSHIGKMLSIIGYRGRNVVRVFTGIKVLCAILLPASLFLIKLLINKPIPPLFFFLLLIVLALAGSNIPNIWLRIKIAGRKEKILEGFPDALDLLVVCVEAGMGLDAAIDRVGEEMGSSNGPLSEELRLFNMEMRVGKSRSEALKGLSSRTDLEDMKSLVTLLIQTDRFGTSMAQALRIHSDTLRGQRYQRAEEKAMKLPVKLLLPLIFCIFPALFVVILGPAITQAYRLFGR
jgi:tight adherence protein C